MYPIATALRAPPDGVARPEMLAANATAISRARRNSTSLRRSRFRMIAKTIVSMMAATAWSLISIAKKLVIVMTPNRSMSLLRPIRRISDDAIALSAPLLPIASARIRLPRMKKTVSSAYGANATFGSSWIRNRTRPAPAASAVTGNGKTSVTQK